jgi:hypothetical protein
VCESETFVIGHKMKEAGGRRERERESGKEIYY